MRSRPRRAGLPGLARLAPLALLGALLGAAALGCAPENVADRQFATMREQVGAMEVDRDKADQRISALAVPVAEMPASDRALPAEGVIGSAAATRTVQLGGPADSDPLDPNDETPRPDIRVTGAGGAVQAPRPRSGKSSKARGDADEFADVRGADSPRVSALDPDARKAYEAALAQVQAKQFDRGLEGLSAFLVRWPDHPYAENAMYWRGEALFGKGEYLRAAEQFESVLTRFGGGNKGPDALLKLGMCHDRLGASSRAREYWDRLKNDYPRSDAAKRIPSASRDATPGKRSGSGDNSGSREDSSPKGPKENR